MSVLQSLNEVFADVFAFYAKAHSFHWNVEGPAFPSYHKLFGDIYTDAWGSIDDIAEHIRTIDEYAPVSIVSMISTKIQPEMTIPPALEMVQLLANDNLAVLESLTDAYLAAEGEGLYGLSNFIQGRIDTHEKWGWMLRSTAKMGM